MVADIGKKHEVIKRTGTTVYTGTDIVRWQQPPAPSAAVSVCISRVTVFRQIPCLKVGVHHGLGGVTGVSFAALGSGK